MPLVDTTTRMLACGTLLALSACGPSGGSNNSPNGWDTGLGDSSSTSGTPDEGGSSTGPTGGNYAHWIHLDSDDRLWGGTNPRDWRLYVSRDPARAAALQSDCTFVTETSWYSREDYRELRRIYSCPFEVGETVHATVVNTESNPNGCWENSELESVEWTENSRTDAITGYDYHFKWITTGIDCP